MSDLLIILVVLGILIVVGVVLFNWWQERKFHSKISNDFKPTKRDVLIEDFQINTAAVKKEKNTQHNERKENFTSDNVKQSRAIKREPEIDLFGLSDTKTDQQDAPIAFETSIPVLENATEHSTTPHSQKTAPIGTLDFDEVDAPSDVESDWGKDDAPTTTDRHVEKPSSQTINVEDALLPNGLCAQIDLIAVLYASIPLTQPNILAVIQGQLDQFNERHFCYGLSHTDEWIAVVESKPEAMFTKLAFSLQLADRGGAVSRATLNRFQHLVETLGLELSAHVEWQGAGDPLNAAVTLDQFCIEVDKTVGFHLVTHQGAAFHATKLRGLMEAQGLELGQDGKFHLYHPQLPDLLEFSVKNYEGNPFSADMLKNSVMHGVTFQLDIPTVKNSADVFDRMTVMAKTLAKNLDATMVDDNRKELGDLQLEKIRQQLKMINATMIAKGIIPGSPHALRLFS